MAKNSPQFELVKAERYLIKWSLMHNRHISRKVKVCLWFVSWDKLTNLVNESYSLPLNQWVDVNFYCFVADQRVPGEAGGSGECRETRVSCGTQHPRDPAQEHDGQWETTAVRLPQLWTRPGSPRLGPGEGLQLSMLSYVS